MRFPLLNIADSTDVATGHQSITEQINLLSVTIVLLVVVGLVLIIRYLLSERRRKG